jgi:putative DNA primase/helicase
MTEPNDCRSVLGSSLPELIAAPMDIPIFIVEGEKDADRLAGLGLVATTNSEGAEKWKPELNEFFQGRIAYILADKDDVGRRHAHNIAANLKPGATSVRVIELDGLPPHGDVSDWLDGDKSRTADMLLAECQQAPEWTEASAPNLEECDENVLTEDYVALEFARRNSTEIRWCSTERGWYSWDGTRWRKDETAVPQIPARNADLQSSTRSMGLDSEPA